mgnify:CR=1 FL=1
MFHFIFIFDFVFWFMVKCFLKMILYYLRKLCIIILPPCQNQNVLKMTSMTSLNQIITQLRTPKMLLLIYRKVIARNSSSSHFN